MNTLSLLLLTAAAPPPEWQVSAAAVPAYQVAAGTSVAAAPDDVLTSKWNILRDAIGKQPVIVAVGVPLPREYAVTGCFPSGFMGYADGVYDGVLENGVPTLRARGVPAPVPFASSSHGGLTGVTSATTAGTTAPAPYPTAGRAPGTSPAAWGPPTTTLIRVGFAGRPGATDNCPT